MVEIRFIYSDGVIATDDTNSATGTADVTSQYRFNDNVRTGGDIYQIDHVEHNLENGSVDIYLKD